tara:strand:+ start:1516 stop:1890 length:375 start_codon:yes stop_codon:yes gene_type:complete
MSIELREDGSLDVDGRIVRFPQRIYKFVEYQDIIVICLVNRNIDPADPMVGRNILALDRQGNLLWRVEDHGFEYQDPDADRLLPQPFIGLGVNPKINKLRGVLPYVCVTIDEKTGGVSDPVINR